MGGAAGNALSIARSLGRQGVAVYLLGAPDSPVAFSRYARSVPLPSGVRRQEAWTRYLLGPESDSLRGAVLLACCDDGIEMLIEHRDELADKFILDISDPAAQRCLLNKLTTYQQARDVGVPTPLFWSAESDEQVRARKDEYVYPLIVKPLYSHAFQAVFGAKFFRVTDFRELWDAYRRARSQDLDVVLLEEIPGPDDLLCSYYTYLDENGVPLFDFTKRVIRRFPEGHGVGCYHVTDWNPEVRDLGLRLFSHVGLLGLGNIEFKRDERDGQLKVIECNARFTAANLLVVRSGYDLGLFVYDRLVGDPHPTLKEQPYRLRLHLWYPDKDFRAFLALRRRGKLSFSAWLASLAHRQVLPYFSWSDPLPSVIASLHFARRALELGVRFMGRRAGFDRRGDVGSP